MNQTIENFLKENNFKSLNTLQKQVVGKVDKDGQWLVMAPTGSGKTLGYLIPLFSRIKKEEGEENSSKAIILAPTRELAKQVFNVAKTLSYHIKLRVRNLDKYKNFSDLKKFDSCDILVTVPGVLNKLMALKGFHEYNISSYVLDEFDQLVQGDFLESFKKLVNLNPNNIIYTSATGTASDVALLESLVESKINKIFVGKDQISQKVDTFNVFLSFTEKDEALKKLLDSHLKGKGIVFLNSKTRAQLLFERLNDPSRFILIHGDLTAEARRKAQKEFSTTKKILISTDIMARGIDVAALSWVVNYDIPKNSEYYIHRCGRTGRNGIHGQVYNFVSGKDQLLVQKINDLIRRQSALKLKSIPFKKQAPLNKKKTKANASDSSKNPKAAYNRKKKVKRTPRYKRKK